MISLSRDDVNSIAAEIEQVIQNRLGGKPIVAAAFTLPPNYNTVHYVSNTDRAGTMTLFTLIMHAILKPAQKGNESG